MRVLALGSCRIHRPLQAAQLEGAVEYLNRRFWSFTNLYLHDIHEAIQFVRLARGESAMPAEIRPFAFERWARLDLRRLAALEQAECVVVEICTDKHYEVAGFTLNLNRIKDELVTHSGAAGLDWWGAIGRGKRPPEALVERVESALRVGWRTRWRFGEGHRRVLRELVYRRLSAEEIAEGIARLETMLPPPFLVVPHVAVRQRDGGPLAERQWRIEKIVEAASLRNLPLFDPGAVVAREGQSRAFANGGLNFNHYASGFFPVMGRAIVGALRQATTNTE